MKLIKYPDPILNKISSFVHQNDLKDVLNSVKEMTEIMKSSKGVGLAAVQVGILKRYALLDFTKDNWKDPTLPDVMLLINPSIKDQKNIVRVSEGCLSLPRFHEMQERPTEVLVSYKDEEFKDKDLILTGLMAQCICHEIDHMNGILQLSKVSKMKQDMWEKAARKRNLL